MSDEFVEVRIAVRMNTRGHYVAFGDSNEPHPENAALEWIDGDEFPLTHWVTAQVRKPSVPPVIHGLVSDVQTFTPVISGN